MLGLSEPLEVINRRLRERYGVAELDCPNWRIVWADNNLTEKRYGTFTKFDDHGNPIGEFTGVEIRPKYGYINNRWVLERFTWVPPNVETDLVEKHYYHPTWTFEDKNKNPLPAEWEAIEIIIETVMRAAARATGAKYKETNADYTMEQMKRRIRIMEELFGNETKVTDALRYKDGVSFGGIKPLVKE